MGEGVDVYVWMYGGNWVYTLSDDFGGDEHKESKGCLDLMDTGFE